MKEKKIDKNGDNIDEMIFNLKKYNLPIDETNYFTKKSKDMLEKNQLK